MTKLIYVPRDGFACPGDGWPAADHEEPDTQLAQLKVNSGFYRDAKGRLRPQGDEEPIVSAEGAVGEEGN